MIDSAELVELYSKIEKLEMSNVCLIAELGRIAQALGVEPSMKSVLGKIEELRACKLSMVYGVSDGFYFETEAEAEKYNNLTGNNRGVSTDILHANKWVCRISDDVTERQPITLHKSGEELAKERTLRCLSPGMKELLGIAPKAVEE